MTNRPFSQLFFQEQPVWVSRTGIYDLIDQYVFVFMNHTYGFYKSINRLAGLQTQIR